MEIKNESELEQLVKVEAYKFGCSLLRNNSGALKDSTGRVVRYGLGAVSKKHDDQIKSSDEIGFTKITITQDMVGKTVAIFTAVEVKHPDWRPIPSDKRWKAQEAFINWVKNNGGIAFVTTSVQGFKSSLQDALWSLGV